MEARVWAMKSSKNWEESSGEKVGAGGSGGGGAEEEA